MSYEELTKELEDIMQKLESGETSFDESMSLFERGAQICRDLNSMLDSAKGKITVIREELGALIEEDLK